MARSAKGNQFCAPSGPAHSDLASISARIPVSSCSEPFGSSRGLSISMICRHRCARGSVERIESVVQVKATRFNQDDRDDETGSACRAINGTKEAWKRKWLYGSEGKRRLQNVRQRS